MSSKRQKTAPTYLKDMGQCEVAAHTRSLSLSILIKTSFQNDRSDVDFYSSLLDNILQYLSYMEASSLKLLSKSSNSIITDHLFASFGACKSKGGRLQYDRDIVDCTPKSLKRFGLIGKNVLGTGRSQWNVCIPATTDTGLIKFGLTRPRNDMTDCVVNVYDDDGNTAEIHEDDPRFADLQKYQKQLFRRHHDMGYDGIRLPKEYRKMIDIINDFEVILQVRSESIRIEEHKRIGEHRLKAFGGHIKNSHARTPGQNISFILTYTTKELFSCDKRACLRIECEDLGYLVETWYHFNGSYVWFVEIGPHTHSVMMNFGGNIVTWG